MLPKKLADNDRHSSYLSGFGHKKRRCQPPTFEGEYKMQVMGTGFLNVFEAVSQGILLFSQFVLFSVEHWEYYMLLK